MCSICVGACVCATLLGYRKCTRLEERDEAEDRQRIIDEQPGTSYPLESVVGLDSEPIHSSRNNETVTLADVNPRAPETELEKIKGTGPKVF